MSSSESTAHKKRPELSSEQWAAGREIAEFCGISKDVLNQNMLWNGDIATVGYGLAHSAHYMDALTTEEIRTAIFNGIADYQATLGNPDGAR
jgi:hypothetical protein